MKPQTNQTIPWSDLELTGLLEDEDSHVHFVRMTKHLALHPYHLNNIQQGVNQILNSLLHTYDRELKGFVLTYKNPKLICNLTEVRFDSPFVYIDVDTEFYLFRPLVGSYVKGTVNKKGLDYIVVLVNKMYTISVPKPDDADEWLGDLIEVGQEVRCCINHIDYMCRPPFICATLQSDYSQGCRININNVYEMSNGIENNSESTSQFDWPQERKININDYVVENYNTMNDANVEVEEVANVKIKVEKMSSPTEDEVLSDRERYSSRKKKKRRKSDEDVIKDKNESIVKFEHDESLSDGEQKKHEKSRKSNEDVFKDQSKNTLKSERDKFHLNEERNSQPRKRKRSHRSDEDNCEDESERIVKSDHEALSDRERDGQRKKRKKNHKSNEDVCEDESERTVKSEHDEALTDKERKKRKKNHKSNEDVCEDESERTVKSEHDEALTDKERKKRKRSRKFDDEDVNEDKSEKNIVKSEHDKVRLNGERDGHRKKQKRNSDEDVFEDKSESILKSEFNNNKVLPERDNQQKKQKRNRKFDENVFEDESKSTVKSEHSSSEINNVKIKQEKFSEVEN